MGSVGENPCRCHAPVVPQTDFRVQRHFFVERRDLGFNESVRTFSGRGTPVAPVRGIRPPSRRPDRSGRRIHPRVRPGRWQEGIPFLTAFAASEARGRGECQPIIEASVDKPWPPPDLSLRAFQPRLAGSPAQDPIVQRSKTATISRPRFGPKLQDGFRILSRAPPFLLRVFPVS